MNKNRYGNIGVYILFIILAVAGTFSLSRQEYRVSSIVTSSLLRICRMRTSQM